MKKITVFLALLLLPILKASAQVGIGTTSPHVSSALEIAATNKGVLLPRVDLGEGGSIIPSPQKSLLVWNTDENNGGEREGFYFWDGNFWRKLMVGQEKIFAEMVKSDDPVDVQSQNPIFFNSLVYNQGINANSSYFEVQISGFYRVSYQVAFEKTSGSGNFNVGVFLAKSANGLDEVPSSKSFVHINNNNEVDSAGTTKYVHLEAGDHLYLFTDTNSDIIKVIPEGTHFNIELVEATEE